jgi:predicted nuclease of predicted toxin-antitoxin system
MLRFIVDTQLPAALAVYLSGYDLDAIHTTFYPAGHLLKDREIREKAVAEDRIIITKDSDFFDYFFVKGAPPRILLLKVGNCSNRELRATVEKNLNEIIHLFAADAELVVVQTDTIIAY